ncbi:hypothetical protein NG798_05205 [Ancylothrix sp. C2]|uniref:hypothetical protein n=1 Tax=Ancylothrix sp. D3o TaxID=2953691 RepID=UPI0021BB4E14|nr:hypothetical protein [Ancylothrix sp. D3o]MCT7949178.1 hypothetical protein [Ancylothrix sp. D3o]
MEPQEIPTEKIKEKLRQTLAADIFGVSNQHPPAADEDEDIVILKTGFDIYNIPITSYQKFMQPVIIGLRKFVRKLLKPVLERQVIYNFTNTQILQSLRKEVKVLKENQIKLETQIQQLQTELEKLKR